MISRTIMVFVTSMSLAISPFFSFVTNATATASIMLIDPPAATANVTSIAVRGLDWGSYKQRRNPQAWLVDPIDNTLYQLTVAKNYDDCSLALIVRGECSDDQLFLRLEIPQETIGKLSAKMYGLYVVTENMVSAMGQFTIVDNPLPKIVQEPTLMIDPIKGPVGTYVMLFGAGFPNEGLNVRFDGVKISVGGYFSPQDDGTFENIAITIPSTLTRDNKTSAVLPGVHTIDVSNDNPTNPRSAAVKFIVQDKVESDPAKKTQNKKELEQIEKDRKIQEQIDNEQQRLEQEQKKIEQEKALAEKQKADLQKQLDEQKKKEQQEFDTLDKIQLKKNILTILKKINESDKQKSILKKKLTAIDIRQDVLDKKENAIKTQFCDRDLPLTFQSGCVQLKKEPQKSSYEGRPCSADLPITFQSGCIGQIPSVQKSLFVGRMCSGDIPLVWQEGCVQLPRQETRGEFEGKQCDPLKAITFQPGCTSLPRKETETLKPITQQKCNPLIPHYSQVGCSE